MTCPRERELRAQLDDELAPIERERLELHLAQCPRCRERLTGLKRAADLAGDLLAVRVRDPQPDSRLALATIRSRIKHQQAISTGNYGRILMNKRSWRTVLAGIAVVALLAGVFVFPASRAAARQFLSVFRVRRFAVIEVDPSESQLEEIGRQLEDNLFLGEPEVILDEPEVGVSDLDQARELAGFDVRMPAYLPGEGSPEIRVKGHTRSVFRFPGQGLAMLLDMADMDPGQIPADLTEGTVTVDVPAMVLIKAEQVHIVQAFEPSVDYPDGVDPALIGEAGLRILGVPPAEARRISERVDWNNTLVLPIPTSIAEVTTAEIAGEEGVLLRPRDYSSGGDSQVLLWEKGGVVYMVEGRVSSETLVQVAESMF